MNKDDFREEIIKLIKESLKGYESRMETIHCIPSINCMGQRILDAVNELANKFEDCKNYLKDEFRNKVLDKKKILNNQFNGGRLSDFTENILNCNHYDNINDCFFSTDKDGKKGTNKNGDPTWKNKSDKDAVDRLNEDITTIHAQLINIINETIELLKKQKNSEIDCSNINPKSIQSLIILCDLTSCCATANNDKIVDEWRRNNEHLRELDMREMEYRYNMLNKLIDLGLQ